MLLQRHKLEALFAEALAAARRRRVVGGGAEAGEGGEAGEEGGESFWKIWVRVMVVPDPSWSKRRAGTFAPCSEFEAYFNFALARFPETTRLRPLDSLNTGRWADRDSLRREGKLHWAAFHWYLRERTGPKGETASHY